MIWPWNKATDDSSLDAIRVGLSKSTVPEPSPDLLARILASREAGVRVVLPEAPVRARHHVYGRLAAAAAAVAALTWLGAALRSSREAGDNVPRGGSSLWSLDGMPFEPASAAAQEAGAKHFQPRYPVITEMDSARVHVGEWTFESRSIVDGIVTTTRGRGTTVTADTSYEGRSAWVFRDVPENAVSRTRMTVLVTKDRLRPLRVEVTGKRWYLVQLFSPDSMAESLTVTGPKARHFRGTAALPGGRTDPLLLGRSHLMALLQTVPMTRDWRGSVFTVGWLSLADRIVPFIPMDLRVVGRERISVPAGMFDCWKLEVREGESKFFAWVSRDTQWLVKTWQRPASDWVEEQVLLSAPPAPTPPAP